MLHVQLDNLSLANFRDIFLFLGDPRMSGLPADAPHHNGGKFTTLPLDNKRKVVI